MLLGLKSGRTCDLIAWLVGVHFLTGATVKPWRNTEGKPDQSIPRTANHELCHHTDDVTQH
jgi:hypothetical protein